MLHDIVSVPLPCIVYVLVWPRMTDLATPPKPPEHEVKYKTEPNKNANRCSPISRSFAILALLFGTCRAVSPLLNLESFWWW